MATQRANVESIYRLSPLQEGILYHCLESKSPGVYHVQFHCVYRGLQPTHLIEAWQAVTMRHPVLRTLFTWQRREQPLQVVRAHCALPIEQVDWRDADDEEQSRRWESYLLRDRDRGFNLERAPLMRLALARLSDDAYHFLCSFHHLILDGSSMRLILHEVATLYTASVRNQAASLPQAPGFEDFIAWLHQRDVTADEAFWRDTLDGARVGTPFRLDGDGGASRSDVVATALDADQYQNLREFARKQRITLNTAIVGAWAKVLGVYTASDEVIVGATVSGRPTELPNVEHMAGLFINSLPIRVPLAAPCTVVDWLRALQQRQVALHPFQHTALTDIHRFAGVTPGTRLFDALVVFENMLDAAPKGNYEAGIVAHQGDYSEFSHYPLALLVIPGETLELRAVHDRARFSHQNVARLLRSLSSVLESMAHEPELPLAELELVPKSERKELAKRFNQTAHDLGVTRCMHQMIAHQARHAPEAIAVRDSEHAITYRSLLYEANQLATALRARGVSDGVLVPMLMNRSCEAVIAIIAIWQAGGAYVPIDPDWPVERIGQVLDDVAQSSELPVVLCGRDVNQTLGVHQSRVLHSDASFVENEAFGQAPSCDPDQLAYVIYTSGSTGQPKGVMVTHANLFNSTRAREVFYPTSPHAFLMLSPLATDSSIAGLFWTLACTGTLLLPRKRMEQNLAELGAFISTHGATHMLCLPSLYATMLEHCDLDALSSLNTIIVAGEACAASVLEQHRSRTISASLFNEYGPSEATVWAIAASLNDVDIRRRVPIGTPIANTTAFVLDEQQRPVPLGAPGELYIGGLNVARGYLSHPQQTRDRFISCPFGDDGGRLYRTGDRVRQREDGMIEFLGRIDNQVKIRGYRVELEEIESTLRLHPDVAEVAVTLVDSTATLDVGDPIHLAHKLESLDPQTANRLLDEVEKMSNAQADARLTRLRQRESESHHHDP